MLVYYWVGLGVQTELGLEDFPEPLLVWSLPRGTLLWAVFLLSQLADLLVQSGRERQVPCVSL